MSMLSEPRRRQKWCLNPRGNLWAKDENKLGQKMLEKLGWKSGDGLGSSRQGIIDPIALKANSESKGLGHIGGDHDVWYGHKDNFDEVLASLNSEHSNDTPEQVSSLASASKKAKKRVHYHKFTKGKDLSGYSQDDLSCILGTKELKSIGRLKKSKSSQEEQEQLLENEEEQSNQEEGGQIIIQGGSMNDYFQKKMKLLTAKRNVKVEPVTIDDVVEKPIVRKKKKEEQMALVDIKVEVKDEEKEMTKKSKRKRKGQEIEGKEEVEPKKKSKKNKIDNTEVEEEQEKKSKKKKKKTVEDSDSSSQDSKDSTLDQTKPEKKSKKKKVDSFNSSSQEVVPSSKDEEKLGKKSKKDEKKSRKSEPDLDLQELFNSGQAIDEIIGFKGSNLSTIVGYGLKDPQKLQWS